MSYKIMASGVRMTQSGRFTKRAEEWDKKRYKSLAEVKKALIQAEKKNSKFNRLYGGKSGVYKSKLSIVAVKPRKAKKPANAFGWYNGFS